MTVSGALSSTHRSPPIVHLYRNRWRRFVAWGERANRRRQRWRRRRLACPGARRRLRLPAPDYTLDTAVWRYGRRIRRPTRQESKRIEVAPSVASVADSEVQMRTKRLALSRADPTKQAARGHCLAPRYRQRTEV